MNQSLVGLTITALLLVGCASDQTGAQSRPGANDAPQGVGASPGAAPSPTPSADETPVKTDPPAAVATGPLTRVVERVKFGSKGETAFSRMAFSNSDSAVWLKLGESPVTDPYSNGLKAVSVVEPKPGSDASDLFVVLGWKKPGFPDLYHITSVQDGDYMYLVSAQDSAITTGGNILVFDVHRGELLGGLPDRAFVSGGTPVFNPKTNLYYYPVSCEVGTINTLTLRSGKRFQTSCGIWGLALSSDGRNLFVSIEDGLLEIYDATTLALEQTLQTNEYFRPIASDEPNALIVGLDGASGEILQLDRESGSVVNSTFVCDSLYDAAMSPDRQFIYATCNEGSVKTLAADSLETVNEIRVKGEPREIMLNENGSLGFVLTDRLLILSE